MNFAHIFYRFLFFSALALAVAVWADGVRAEKAASQAAPTPVAAAPAAPVPMPAGTKPSFAPANVQINGQVNDQPAPEPVSASKGKGAVVDVITAEDPEAPLAGTVTHPPLKLTPDKSELVKLNGEASSIILGNPNHVSILADTARTLVLVPRAPGATFFTVMDRQGNILMQRHVLVAAPTEKYVRIRRSCNSASGSGCQPTQVYYCPDMCHEIIMGGEMDQTASNQPAVSGSNSAMQDEDGGGDNPDQPEVATPEN